MIKVATILPQAYLQLSENDTYVMALAHLIGAPGMERYTDFFIRKGQEEQSFVIMDNGVIEGDPRPIAELYDKALMIGASELILPDVFRDSKRTLDLVNNATTYLAGRQETLGEMGLMAVAQGETLDEWVECALALLDNPMVSCIGVPKVLVDIAGRDGRYIAISELMDRAGDLGGRELHLLGCWQSPLELSILSKAAEIGELPEIRGVDSAIAYVYARAGKAINDADRPDSHPIDFKNGEIAHKAQLRYNIMLWKDAVDMRADKEYTLE